MNRLWRPGDGVLLLLLGMAPLFFIGGPDWLSPPLVRELWSQGHWLFFAGLLYWWQRRWPLTHPRQWLLATLAVLLVSALIEGLQTIVGRQAGWSDVVRNVTGTWLGLFWGQRPDKRIRGGRLLAVALLLWQMQELGRVALAHGYQQHRFPVLGDFESRLDAIFWEGRLQRVTEPVAEGRYSLAIEVGGDRVGRHESRYTGAHLRHLVSDWRGYDTLSFSLHNPGPGPLTLTLRINDTRHDRGQGDYDDRYNQPLTLAPGWNHYRIDLNTVTDAPKGRAMDMAEVQRLLFFVTDLAQTRRVYLDQLKLEKDYVEPNSTAAPGEA